jgi:hypothetical protein
MGTKENLFINSLQVSLQLQNLSLNKQIFKQ